MKVDGKKVGQLHLSSVSMKMSSSVCLVDDHQGLCSLFYTPVHCKKSLLFGEIQVLKFHFSPALHLDPFHLQSDSVNALCMAWLVCSFCSLQQLMLLGAEAVFKAALLRQKKL